MIGRVAILGIESELPTARWTSAAVEARIRANSPDLRIPDGLIGLLSGVEERRYVDAGVNASDLAASAACRVLATTGTDAAAVDLLVFASASQDLAEPATANIVQEKIGTHAAVFDVKNACNSFLNGLQVAAALIASGQATVALVVTGEVPSCCIRWHAPTRADLLRNLPGYTLGDAGAAALLTGAVAGSGIRYSRFQTASQFWSLATLPGGGTMHPRGDEWTYIRGDGAGLKEAFSAFGPELLHQALAETGTTLDDFAAILVHQVSLPYLRDFATVTGIPLQRTVVTLPCLGNMASASLPVAFVQARDEGRIRPGDQTLWIGLAAGISAGIMIVTV